MENNVNKIIQHRKNTARLKRIRFGFFKKITVIVAVCVLVFSLVFGITNVHGVDMSPAIKDGDIAVYLRLGSDYNNGDIIVFEQDGKDYISRIAATSGDELKEANNGELVFNDRLHPINKDEGLFYKTMARRKIKYPIRLGEGEFFVLGDKRDSAEDSRYFGIIKREQIKGKVFTLIRKRGL